MILVEIEKRWLLWRAWEVPLFLDPVVGLWHPSHVEQAHVQPIVSMGTLVGPVTVSWLRTRALFCIASDRGRECCEGNKQSNWANVYNYKKMRIIRDGPEWRTDLHASTLICMLEITIFFFECHVIV